MAKLKPWYHVVTPREDLRENRPLDASEFAVHLDHIRQGRAHEDYLKPSRFFDRTYMTRSLSELCAQTIRRLSGIKVETSAVFNMATQFGGGKTHALTALYHLARGGEDAKAWKGIDAILKKAQTATVPKASVAVFVGTEFDVVDGRGGAGEPVRKTPWGDIAWQLGGKESFNAIAEHDKQGIAPGGDKMREMLPSGPCLILMDELLNYVSRGRKAGMRDQLFDFLQVLSEEARARDNVVLCVSVPASELEMNPEDQRDHEALKKLLDRVGKALMMSAETEVAEIIRRRLFEWSGLPGDARRIADEFAEWAMDHAAEISGSDASNARDLFTSCYPFHPSVLSVFERKWQTLPRFQRTRGILRLLALWVAYSYQEEHRRAGDKGELLIGLGSAPVEDPTFRAALFEQLGSNDLEGPVTTDIAGDSNAWAVRLDREGPEAIKKAQLHRKAATTILFESNGGQTKAHASVPEIKAAVGAPDLNLAEVDNVLEGLATSCYYLSLDANRYRFSLNPNLNKVLTDRKAGVHPNAIEELLKKEIETQYKHKPADMEIDCRYWPENTSAVPNRPVLTLVVLGPETPRGSADANGLMESVVRECGSSGRTYKSAVIFAVPESPQALSDAARTLLAWEDIDDDEDTRQRLDEAQQRQLKTGIGRARADLKEAIWRAYRYLCLLDKENNLKEIDLGQITSSMAPSMLELMRNRLVSDDEISPGPGPSKLVRYWPPALEKWSTKAVRDSFFSSPVMPRLLKGEVVKRTIADGVTEGVLGYAREIEPGQLKLVRFAESMSEAEVEISDETFVLRADDAQKLREPPRLAELRLQPGNVTIRPGEKVAFTVSALDQYRQPIELADLEWSATGGSITEAGEYASSADPGLYSVKARSGHVEGLAEVRVQTADQPPPPPPGGKGMLGWSGQVPPQKWMNFYTKVLSRFAQTEGLKLEVSFQVPVEDDERSARESETKASLRDLGLSDDVSTT